jgi:tetratricopeptide (TPR) repeat protein
MTQGPDDKPTRPTTFSVADVDAFRLDPRDDNRFAALRRALRGDGARAALAEVCELRAPFEADPTVAATRWAEAGALRDELGQPALAERDLKAACALDPTSPQAAARLVELLLAAGKHAEAGAVLEAELTELERRAAAATGRAERAATARRAERHRAAAEIWDRHLGRVDRALHHWQQAWRLEPERTDALAAARALYASLGDDAMVGRLYRSELDVLGARAPAAARAPLHYALGRLLLRQGDGPGAAAALEQAVALATDDVGAREALAEVYLSATWARAADDPASGPGRASALYLDLARRGLAAGDVEPALSFLRRAVGVDPDHGAAAAALEEALDAAERWDELERLLAQRAAQAGDDDERRRVLARLVALHDGPRPDRPALIAALTELAALEPARGPAALRARQLLREEQRWRDLAAAIERDRAGLDGDPATQVGELLELAALAREHLGDKDRAAELLHHVLTLAPGHDEALARYVDHFRERRDFRGLVEVYEFALDNARAAAAPASDQVRRLEDIAQVCEIRLGDVPRALDAWQRIEALEPGNPRAREALRRLAPRARTWDQLAVGLEAEVAATTAPTVAPTDRADSLRRIALTYREHQVDPRRAIALFEEVIALRPDDAVVLKALLELYEREGDDTGVARSLRRQLELDSARLTAELAASGRPGAAREWPIGRRVERLAALRRLAAIPPAIPRDDGPGNRARDEPQASACPAHHRPRSLQGHQRRIRPSEWRHRAEEGRTGAARTRP